MKPKIATAALSSQRMAGWLTILSGIAGLVAIGCLFLAVTTRTTWTLSGHVYLLFRAHDAGVTLQFLLLIPFVIELRRRSRDVSPAMSRSVASWGIGSIAFVALLLVLGMGSVVNDMFYMLPQGIFGAWLLLINVRFSGSNPRWLRVFGVVVALGLLLVGTVFPGLATFVYPNMWKIPAVPVESETLVHSGMNRALHLILAIGSIMGVLTLPVWTLMMGSHLLRRRTPEPTDVL